MTNQVLRTALACAQLGWPVFPCQPGRKTPATPHGYLDASTDPAQLGEWFTRHPGRNIAVVTGNPGPDVLDIDYRGPASTGFPALTRLRDAGLLDNAAARVRTPGGGLHIYFAGTRQRSFDFSLPSAWLECGQDGDVAVGAAGQHDCGRRVAAEISDRVVVAASAGGVAVAGGGAVEDDADGVAVSMGVDEYAAVHVGQLLHRLRCQRSGYGLGGLGGESAGFGLGVTGDDKHGAVAVPTRGAGKVFESAEVGSLQCPGDRVF
jgi:hypothetical protein